MEPYEKVIAEAIRLEYDEVNDRLFIVFEVSDPKMKKEIKLNWCDDIEYKLIGKNLVK